MIKKERRKKKAPVQFLRR